MLVKWVRRWIPARKPATADGANGAGPAIALKHYGRFAPEVEAYRSLRVNLELITQRRDVKTILVTSPGPLEGKSTTLINLGVMWWETGATVSLVDADLRRPSLHTSFHLSPEEGLTDLVLGRASSLKIQKTLREGFSVVTAGSHYGKPNVLLSSVGMRQSLVLFREAADVVLIDSSPLLMVSDALMLATAVDGVLLVTRRGYTTRREALRAKKLLESAGANILGVVLNMAERPSSRYHYSRYNQALLAPEVRSDPVLGEAVTGEEPDAYPFLVR